MANKSELIARCLWTTDPTGRPGRQSAPVSMATIAAEVSPLAALAALAALSEQQDGVIARRQLRALGVSRHLAPTRLGGKRWQRVGRQVLVLQTGPLTDRQLDWVSVLAMPGPAALAGLTVANRQGLSGFGETARHVLVPRGTHVERTDGVVLHVSRRFSEADLHPSRLPPQVRFERAVIDGAAWSSSPRRACAVVAAAVQQRLTTAARLSLELRAAGQVRHRALLFSVLADIGGGSHSLAEIDFYRLCRRAGLPLPRRQVVRQDATGRRRYLDADFGNVVVEVDGALHLRPLDWWDDMARQNELVIDGRRVLRFPSLVVLTQTEVVERQLRAALGLG